MAARSDNSVTEETVVIYWSEADGYWIAHGVHTDQVGVGERPVDALSDFMVALREIWQLAAEDESVAVFREAPTEIQRKAHNAEKLPGEIFEIAHKMATGGWPDDWEPPTPTRSKKHRFRADVGSDFINNSCCV